MLLLFVAVFAIIQFTTTAAKTVDSKTKNSKIAKIRKNKKNTIYIGFLPNYRAISYYINDIATHYIKFLTPSKVSDADFNVLYHAENGNRFYSAEKLIFTSIATAPYGEDTKYRPATIAELCASCMKELTICAFRLEYRSKITSNFFIGYSFPGSLLFVYKMADNFDIGLQFGYITSINLYFSNKSRAIIVVSAGTYLLSTLSNFSATAYKIKRITNLTFDILARWQYPVESTDFKLFISVGVLFRL